MPTDSHSRPAPLGTTTALALLLLLAASGPARAAETAVIEDPVVRACAERSLPSRALHQKLTVQVIDHTGSARESRGVLYWKRFEDGLSRVLVRLTEPPRSAGLAVLMIERAEADPDVYMYLPEERRSRRMTSGVLSGRMLGTDFSYEDFAHFQQLTKSGAITRLPDATVEGRTVHVVETLPDDETSAYGRILTRLDAELCVPVLTEFFSRNGDLEKSLEVPLEAVRPIDDRHVPHRAVMTDVRQESHSVLEVTHAEVDPELRDTLFTPSELRKGR